MSNAAFLMETGMLEAGMVPERPIRVLFFDESLSFQDLPEETRCLACKSRGALGRDPPEWIEPEMVDEGRLALHTALAYRPEWLRRLADYEDNEQGWHPEQGVYIEAQPGRWRRCRIEPPIWTVRRLWREMHAATRAEPKAP